MRQFPSLAVAHLLYQLPWWLCLTLWLPAAGCSEQRRDSQPPTSNSAAEVRKHISAPFDGGGLAEPTDTKPFVAVINCSRQQAADGKVFHISIRGRVAPGWHIYAADRPTGVSAPTTLTLSLPNNAVFVDDWSYPDAEFEPGQSEAVFVYRGDVEFTRRIRLADDATVGGREIACTVAYQACNAFACLPPATIDLSTAMWP